MATVIEAIKFNGGGGFLDDTVTADRVFTRADLSSAQQMFGRIAADFMRTEVLPREGEIYAKDWPLTRELLLKAGELDLLRLDIPEAYGGLGLDKVSSAYVGEQIGIMPSFAGSLGAQTALITSSTVRRCGSPTAASLTCSPFSPKLTASNLLLSSSNATWAWLAA